MSRIFLFAIVLITRMLPAAPQPQTFRHPLVFEPNQGQAPPQMKWLARGAGYQLILTEEGLTMMVKEGIAGLSAKEGIPGSQRPHNLTSAYTKLPYSSLQMKLTGSRPWRNVTGLEPTGGISNYLDSFDARDPLTNIPHYARVSVAGVYEGIDLVLYSNGGDLEYDFVIAPGADPRQITLAFEGAEEISVDTKSGDLVMRMAGGSEVRQVRPVVYQQVGTKRVEIAGGYDLLERGRVAFTVAPYDLSFANNRSGYKLLCCNAFITVVESAELWNCNDLSIAQRLSRKRTLFTEAQVGSRIMVVAQSHDQVSRRNDLNSPWTRVG